MSSAKKPAPSGAKPQQHSGQKRPAPVTSTPAKSKSSQPPSAKKAKPTPTPAAKLTTPGFRPPSDDDDDDDEAIFALKAKAAARNGTASTTSTTADEDEFEVAAGSGDEEDGDAMMKNAPPSDDDADDESDVDMEDVQQKPKATPAPQTPAAKANGAANKNGTSVTATKTPLTKPIPAKSTPITPASSKQPSTPAVAPLVKSTPAKPSPALKPTPITPAASAVPVSQKKSVVASSSESETSEDEDDSAAPVKPQPKPTPLPAKPTPTPTTQSSTTTAKPIIKPELKAALGDSSESSESEDDDTAAAPSVVTTYRKPQPARKPTPLQGDASVNPPPKPAPKPKPAPAATSVTPGTSSTFDKSITRPPTAPHTGRQFTVTIALPGSIIGNAQSKELRTYVAGQIARAAATFNVDEIVVFAEEGKQVSGGIQGNFEGATRSTDPDIFLARILQYLETPQYLRKALFPKHIDLSNAGLLNPLDSPHHVRIDEEVPYREGVVVNRPVAKHKSKGGDSSAASGEETKGGCWANIGLRTEAFLDRPIEVGTRVTVHIPQVSGSTSRKSVSGRAVAPSTPREKLGTYWGYTTRLAQSLSQVWSECPFKGGYDLSIGTSEHGVDCHAHDFSLPPFKHAILFFGGLAGLEEHIGADESIKVKTPKDLFQLYINSVIGQGCRTIRTEEAIPITLAALYRHIRTNQPPATSE